MDISHRLNCPADVINSSDTGRTLRNGILPHPAECKLNPTHLYWTYNSSGFKQALFMIVIKNK